MSKCRICNSEETSSIYHDRIRTSSLEILHNFKKKEERQDNLSEDKFDVLYCKSCHTRFLDPFPETQLCCLYKDGDIDEDKRSADMNKLRELYDEYQNNRIKRIGIENFRDQIAVDFGSGVGCFLDAVYGFCKETIAIEPALYVHPELRKKHRVFSHVKELVDDGTMVDIATSFEVIEHVEDPIGYLSDIYRTLKDGSAFYLTTPNYDDILNDLAKKHFDPFYYRTEHTYYFCKKSLEYIYKKAGFTNVNIGFCHRFDMSNLLLWIKQGRPTGKNRYQLFDEEFNLGYCQYLENMGKASHLWVVATK